MKKDEKLTKTLTNGGFGNIIETSSPAHPMVWTAPRSV